MQRFVENQRYSSHKYFSFTQKTILQHTQIHQFTYFITNHTPIFFTEFYKARLVHSLGKHISLLLRWFNGVDLYLVFGIFSILCDPGTKVMIFYIQMLRSRTEFRVLCHFNGAGIVFKYFAIYFRLWIFTQDLSIYAFVVDVEYGGDSSKGIG